MTTEPDDDILRAWLLHRLSDANAAAAFEQRVLEDDAFDMRLRAIETDLLDDYARQRLNKHDRRAMARWLLATSADRLRLRTAIALGNVIASNRAPRRAMAEAGAQGAQSVSSTPRPSAARPLRRRGVFIFAAAAGVLLALLAYEQRHSPLQPSVESLAANAPTITLLANLQRGAQDAPSAVVNIPRTAPMVRLQVEVANGDASPRYTLQIAMGTNSVFESQSLPAQIRGPYRFVEVALASALLDDGDYRVRLAVDGTVQPLQEWTLRARRH
ncbi:MAG: hypothetical protein ABIQ70_08945 [Dokdonella sp.]